jgi:hypothetical protein
MAVSVVSLVSGRSSGPKISAKKIMKLSTKYWEKNPNNNTTYRSKRIC